MLTNRINRLSVQNYRSLGDVTVDLEDLTVLVGLNGSGKSNFLDVLRFVSDVLQHGLESGLTNHDRGGIDGVQRYSSTDQRSDVFIGIDLTLDSQEGHYEFTLHRDITTNDYEVASEKCRLGSASYEIRDGNMVFPMIQAQMLTPESKLRLPLLGRGSEYGSLYQFLIHMGFYSIMPSNLRIPQQINGAHQLDEHGQNLFSVLYKLDEQTKSRLFQSLAAVVPDIDSTEAVRIVPNSSYLLAAIKHEKDIFTAPASESDGTLRALGILAALYQVPPLTLLGIEEPELMLHPGAMGALCDVLKEAAVNGQLIITTHSPDLISRFAPSSLRIVERENGSTKIGPISTADRQAINDQLFNGGDLLRIGGLSRAAAK